MSRAADCGLRRSTSPLFARATSSAFPWCWWCRTTARQAPDRNDKAGQRPEVLQRQRAQKIFGIQHATRARIRGLRHGVEADVQALPTVGKARLVEAGLRCRGIVRDTRQRGRRILLQARILEKRIEQHGCFALRDAPRQGLLIEADRSRPAPANVPFTEFLDIVAHRIESRGDPRDLRRIEPFGLR